MKMFKKGLMLASLALYAISCSHGSDDHSDHDHDHEPHDHGTEKAEKKSADEHDHDDDEIVMSSCTAKRMGVEVTEIQPSDFREVILVSGQILSVPSDRAVAVAPRSGVVTFRSSIATGVTIGAGSSLATVTQGKVSSDNPNAAARVAMEAAKRELDRATPLLADGIISQKEYAELKAAYETARAAYQPGASSGSVTSPIGGVVTALLVNQGEYVEAGQPIAQIARSQRLTLRADLPLRYASRADGINAANFRPAGSDKTFQLSALGGARTGSGQSSEAQGAYMPIYFTFNNPGGEAVPGAMVEVALLGARRPGVITVPVEALSEQMGQMYIYAQIDDEGYQRRPIQVGASDGLNTEIISGVKAGDKVVTRGATAIRLAENSGNMPEGHNHNH